MIAFIGGSSNTSANYTFPVGWTVIDGDSSGGESWRSAYKVAESADVSASDFAFGSTDGEYIGGSITRISNARLSFSNYTKQRVTGGGTFSSSSLTPAGANCLILFYSHILNSANTSSGYACVTSNPSWTEAFDFGSSAPATDMAMVMAYADRLESTATGAFSYTPPGTTDSMGFFICLETIPEIKSSSTVSVSATSSLVMTKPTGLNVGDLLFFHYGYTDATDTMNTLSGWTHEVDNVVAAGSTKIGIQWKIADSGDVAASNFTFTLTGTASAGGALMRIIGALTSNLINDVGDQAPNTGSPTYTNSATPVGTYALYLFLVVGNEQMTVSNYAITTSNPTWTELYDMNNAVMVMSLAYATRPQSTATGDSSCSLASGSGSEDSYGIMVIIDSIENTLVSASVLEMTLNIQSPSISGSSNTSVSELQSTFSIQAPTISTSLPLWKNQSKNAVTLKNIEKS